MLTSPTGRFTSGSKSRVPIKFEAEGPQTQSGGFREGNLSVPCRKLKEYGLVAHHVTSNLTQTETSNYIH